MELSGEQLEPALADFVLFLKSASHSDRPCASTVPSYSECPSLSQVAEGLWVGGIQATTDHNELHRLGILRFKRTGKGVIDPHAERKV